MLGKQRWGQAGEGSLVWEGVDPCTPVAMKRSSFTPVRRLLLSLGAALHGCEWLQGGKGAAPGVAQVAKCHFFPLPGARGEQRASPGPRVRPPALPRPSQRSNGGFKHGSHGRAGLCPHPSPLPRQGGTPR